MSIKTKTSNNPNVIISKKGDMVTLRTTFYYTWDDAQHFYRQCEVTATSKATVSIQVDDMLKVFNKSSGLEVGTSAGDSCITDGWKEEEDIIKTLPALVISLSGGHTSGYIALEANSKRDSLLEIYSEIVYIFANTGAEHPETLKFIQRLDQQLIGGVTWLEAKINPKSGKGTTYTVVNYADANTQGKPLIDTAKKFGIANVAKPSCTRETKATPIKKYCADHFNTNNYKIMVGIRADEFDREGSTSAVKEYNLIYPLLEDKIFKTDIIDFWEGRDDALTIENYEGNCRGCHHKSDKKLHLINFYDSSSLSVVRELEKYRTNGKYKGDTPQIYRGHRSLDSMLSDHNSIKNEDDAIKAKLEIVSRYEGRMVGGGCAEECSPFASVL